MMKNLITLMIFLVLLASNQDFVKVVCSMPDCFNGCDNADGGVACKPGCFCKSFALGGSSQGVCLIIPNSFENKVRTRCLSHVDCTSNTEGGDDASYCLRPNDSGYGYCSVPTSKKP
ncbi:hypothetical protein LIER_41512 [Lithospermum erythrorhizon]|uniref:Uncharacterized protein n=1 Tax=Lithospermum erythrorhizon TaxID=34254 RepID=A0AAV3RAD7_LITER